MDINSNGMMKEIHVTVGGQTIYYYHANCIECKKEFSSETKTKICNACLSEIFEQLKQELENDKRK